MEILDVSIPIRTRMPIYPANAGVALRRIDAIADGAVANVSAVDLGAHTGTHVDAPNHFLDGAGGVDTVALAPLIGPAVVIDATAVDKTLDAAAVAAAGVPAGAERVLFRTRNSQLWEQEEFSEDFVSFDASGARALLDAGVRLVGIDYLSIGDPGAHRALLGADVAVVEGLDLRAVEPGPYQLVCLPLKLVGSDGGPARAVLLRTT
ncbi:MAG TPA: cyclase family protein [Solirubrobacteraceae bacterium]|nr:cyclase family protein [Solirubrobacteraceae bacterium]